MFQVFSQNPNGNEISLRRRAAAATTDDSSSAFWTHIDFWNYLESVVVTFLMW